MKKTLMACIMATVVFMSCDDDDDDNTQVNGTDQQFSLMASMGNFAEVDAGTLAANKATNAGIKMFGQMMVTDHTDAQAKLKALAGTLGTRAVDSLDAEHVALKAQLQSLTGRAFDSVYINSQVNDHTKTIALFQNEISNGNNQQLRSYAADLLPHLQMHLRMADSLRSKF